MEYNIRKIAGNATGPSLHALAVKENDRKVDGQPAGSAIRQVIDLRVLVIPVCFRPRWVRTRKSSKKTSGK
jgi:hypothetical protein